MKLLKLILTIPILIALVAAKVSAADFGWVRGFNVQAEADPSGFRARMEARFKVGDVAVNAVLSNIERPSDAYIVLRLGEISGQPVDFILDQYKNGKAWGALARSIGIKPGSQEFHALKQGQDLYVNGHNSGIRGQAKNTGKGKTKGKGRK